MSASSIENPGGEPARLPAGAVATDTGAPEAVEPGTETPGPEAPGPEAPDPEAPGKGGPGADGPTAGAPRPDTLRKRLLAYGCTAAIVGALVYGGFLYEADPDLLTMLGAVEIQLSQAAIMTPGSSTDAKLAEARAELIARAGSWLDRVDATHPGSAWASWYRGYIAFLNRDYTEAARLYEQTRFRGDCTDELRDKSIINQALMLRESGRHAQAAALLRQHKDDFLAPFAEAARHELEAAEQAAAPAAPAPHPDPSEPAAPAAPR